jgi:hypothetical protein
MKVGLRGVFRWVIAVGAVLVLGSQPWAFAKGGPKISVGDYPSMKEGSPQLVLIDVSDFQ